MKPLPPRYTPLDVSGQVKGRRHFIQFFFWMPLPNVDGQTWVLGWQLNEVVGSRFVPVPTRGTLFTVADATPPATFDVERAVRLQVNADGDAEWEILTGPNSQKGVIPFRSGE